MKRNDLPLRAHPTHTRLTYDVFLSDRVRSRVGVNKDLEKEVTRLIWAGLPYVSSLLADPVVDLLRLAFSG